MNFPKHVGFISLIVAANNNLRYFGTALGNLCPDNTLFLFNYAFHNR